MKASSYVTVLLSGCAVLCFVTMRSMLWISTTYEIAQRQIQLCLSCPMSAVPHSSSPTSNYEHHLMYSLSGSNTGGMFKEFEVSLKSVLLNAPRKGSMIIHILADDPASKALKRTFAQSMKFDPLM